MPERVQLRRTKGYRKPDGAIVVSRPSIYGNPFPVDGSWIMWTAVGLGFRADKPGRRAAAVALHRAWMTGTLEIERQPVALDGGHLEFGDGSVVSVADHASNVALAAAGLYGRPVVPDPPDLTPLRGHDLACWCPLTDGDGNPVPCHASTLIELANQ